MNNKIQFSSTMSFTENVINSNFHKARLKVLHDGSNLNNCIIPLNVIKENANSIKNTPLLIHLLKDEFGDVTGEIGGHDIEEKVIVNSDGEKELRLNYLEQPIGVIPETNNLEYKIEDERTYLYCDAYIWKSYSNEAYDVLLEKEVVNISCEMEIKKIEFHKDDTFTIHDFEFLGVTIIGEDTGMIGTELNMNFSKVDYDDKVKELNTLLEMKMSKKDEEENMENENKNIEEVSVDVENVEETEVVEITDVENTESIEVIEETNSNLGFSLSNDQIEKMIYLELDKFTITKHDPYWNETYTVREYGVNAILNEEKVVVLYDTETYRHWGVNFEIKGDYVHVDMDSKIEYMTEWRAKVGEEQIVTLSNEEDTQLKDKVLAKFSEKENEIEELNKTIESLNEEVLTLQEFKLQTEKEKEEKELLEEVNTIVEEFSLDEEEIVELKEQVLNKEIDVATFTLNVKAKQFDKMQFSKNSNQKSNVSLKVNNVPKADEFVEKINELKSKYIR